MRVNPNMLFRFFLLRHRNTWISIQHVGLRHFCFNTGRGLNEEGGFGFGLPDWGDVVGAVEGAGEYMATAIGAGNVHYKCCTYDCGDQASSPPI